MDLRSHWNKSYLNNNCEDLGWFEKVAAPCLNLIREIDLKPSDKILIIGSGASTLIDSLIELEFEKIIALDISNIALGKLKSRLGESNVKFVLDDVTNSFELFRYNDIMLWQDRAVLHFITDDHKLENYKITMNSSLKKGGYAIIATYALDGADKCNGLVVKRYSADKIAEFLGDDYKLLSDFKHIFTMPNGNIRPYTYTLLKKIG